MSTSNRGPGRPKKSPESRKTAELRIRLAESERAELDKAAGKDTSTWARDVLLKAARRKSNSGDKQGNG